MPDDVHRVSAARRRAPTSVARRVVVVGSNRTGSALALSLRDQLGPEHEVVVISKSEHSVATHALPNIPFGGCEESAVEAPIGPVLEARGIRFKHTQLLRIDLERHALLTQVGEERFDYLVIATGTVPNYGAIPGLGPRGYTGSVASLAEAQQARAAFERFTHLGGPVVIGAVQDGRSDVARALLLNMIEALEKRGMSQIVPITFLCTAAFPQVPPTWLARADVRVIAQASVREITRDQIRLGSGEALRFALALLVPPTIGVSALRNCEALTDPSGLVRVNVFGQSVVDRMIFAAGSGAVTTQTDDLAASELGPDYARGATSHVASNIAAHIAGRPMISHPLCTTADVEVMST